MKAPERAALDAIVAAAGSAYAPAGRTPLHFARGKLRHDPVFHAIVARDVVPDGARLVDLGCGQGVLPAFLFAARGCYEHGEWPAAWPPPPRLASVLGVDLRRSGSAAARVAHGEQATFEVGDVRDAEVPECDVIAILDVLHYLPPAIRRACSRVARARSRPVARCCCGSATPTPARAPR